MAAQLDQSSKEDDLKTQFLTREGTYRLMNLSEYSRPNRVGYTSNQSSPQVRVSIVSMPDEQVAKSGCDDGVARKSSQSNNNNNSATNGEEDLLQVNQISSTTPAASSSSGGAGGGMDQVVVANGPHGGANRLANNHHGLSAYCGGVGGSGATGGDRICFNFGKELFVYPYRGMKKAGPDINKPIDKKLYKGTNPSCHDFNAATASQEATMLLIGFTTGQIQLVQPGRREPGKLFNEDRLIDKTKVTCLKWLPGSSNLFLAGHSSGHLYLYNEELPCVPTAPHYQAHKLGDGFTVHACKSSKVARNPLQKWTFGPDTGSINEFAFSPCGNNLAIASQDGFLRVFRYESMELLGIARSYFGGFLCVCWSPDGKYIVVGGEDDLVTIWSMHERRVVARGQGHRSWVSVVAFDPYTTSYATGRSLEDNDPDVSDDDGVSSLYRNAAGQRSTDHLNNNSQNNSNNIYNNNCSRGGSGSNRTTTGGGGVGNEFYNTNGSGSSNNKTILSNGSIPSNSRSSVRRKSSVARPHSVSGGAGTSSSASTSYRLGSVSQDTQLCLWDITEDLLRQPVRPLRHSSVHSPVPMVGGGGGGGGLRIEVKPTIGVGDSSVVSGAASTLVGNNINNSFSSGNNTNNNNNNNTTGQTPVSSLSSISSSVNNNNNNNGNNHQQEGSGKDRGAQNKSSSGGDAVDTKGAAVTNSGVSGGGGGKGKQNHGTISLIGNCVGNNLHKMTMSSSISSSSSIISNQTLGGANSTVVAEDGAAAVGTTTEVANTSSSSSKAAMGNGGKSSTDSASSSSSGMMSLNAFTQRLSHFSFGNDKKHGEGSGGGASGSGHGHHGKKGFTLSKPFGGHSSLSKSAASSTGGGGGSNSRSADGGAIFRHGGGGGGGEDRLAVTTFDPIKLIGSTACPRFDECPVLEPLICKKIAHERLTALIFREDCFLTACQDGIIYTWARPPVEQGNKLPQT